VSKRTFLALLLLTTGSTGLYSLEAGFIAGHLSLDSANFYGLSAGSGIFIPLTRLEFEGYRFSGPATNTLTAGIAFRPKLGRVAPYMIIGAGADFEKLNFHFSDYRAFSFLGGGCHLFLSSILSLRFDIRFIHSRDENRTRLSGGVFLHI
jgi:hypothetical protein